MSKKNIIETVVINGIKHDCISFDAWEFNLKCSLMGAKEIHELYHSRRRIPIHFRGMSIVSLIVEIKEMISRDNMIDVLIKIA